MLDWVREVYIAFFVLVHLCDKGEKAVILHKSLCHLLRIFCASVSKTVDVVTRGGYADHQSVCVGSLRFLEAVVLGRFLVSCHLVRNGKVAVE